MSPTEPAPAAQGSFPWATAVLAGAAVALFFWPAGSAACIYEREAILRGQWWRAWSGHLVHFGPSHLFWNLMVFLPAGGWLERLRPGVARLFYLTAPLAISTLLLLADPTLGRYAGLSGIATGVLVLLACGQLQRTPAEPRWFWIAVLALVGVKLGAERFTGTPLFVSGFQDIRDVPLAHVGGAAAAIAGWWLSRRGWAACHR